jgi:hypothetical protein
VTAHICNSSTQEAKAVRSRVQVQPRLQSEFKASLDYTARPCLQKSNQKTYLVNLTEYGETERIVIIKKQGTKPYLQHGPCFTCAHTEDMYMSQNVHCDLTRGQVKTQVGFLVPSMLWLHYQYLIYTYTHTHTHTHTHTSYTKNKVWEARKQCLTPVILATWEAKIWRISVWSQPQANSSGDLISKKSITKKELVLGAGSSHL